MALGLGKLKWYEEFTAKSKLHVCIQHGEMLIFSDVQIHSRVCWKMSILVVFFLDILQGGTFTQIKKDVNMWDKHWNV